jgi:hypothetical protein
MKTTQLGLVENSTAPGTPATGQVVVYAKQDGLLYTKSDAGVETAVGGYSGTVTNVSSANADLTVANGTTTPALTVIQAPALRSATTTVNVSSAAAPSAGQVLTATSSTAATWQTPSSAGVYPKFSAYQSVSQSIPAGVDTKVNFQTEEYDTNNNFASSRFTPTVEGYYCILSCIYNNGAVVAWINVMLFKNGVFDRSLDFTEYATIQSNGNGSALVYMNGTTDYVEIYVYTNVATSLSASPNNNSFQGFRVG